jgi:glycolate oxidase subunit GlcD
VCTIGGNVAENSGGPHCLKYGMTTDHLLGATVVLPDGEVARFGGPAGPRGPHELDLLGLFTGSEGTFGIATEIVVRLQRDPEDLRTLLGAFADLDSACAATSAIIAAGMVPAALEIMDQATIRAVEASVYRAGYPAAAGAILLVELDGPRSAVTAEAAEVEKIFATHGAISVEQAEDAATRNKLWRGRKGAYGAMGRLAPDLYLLDGVVPRTHLVEAVQAISAIGAKYRLQLVNFFHAGDGNLHPTISFDGRDPDQRERVLAAGHEILKTCMDLGGSITGEHGVGLEKLDHVGLMFDEHDLEVMARARGAFDPTGLCNPGKVLPERASCAEVGRDLARFDAVMAADDAAEAER